MEKTSHFLCCLMLSFLLTACLQEDSVNSPQNDVDRMAIGRISGDEIQLILPAHEMSRAMNVYFSDGIEVDVSEIRYSKKGKVYFLFTQGTHNNLRRSNAIPLTQTGINFYLPFNAKCAHSCTSSQNNPCSGGCDINNIVPCSSHTCTCVGSGGCDASVVIGGGQQRSKEWVEQFTAFFENMNT